MYTRPDRSYVTITGPARETARVLRFQRANNARPARSRYLNPRDEISQSQLFIPRSDKPARAAHRDCDFFSRNGQRGGTCFAFSLFVPVRPSGWPESGYVKSDLFGFAVRVRHVSARIVYANLSRLGFYRFSASLVSSPLTSPLLSRGRQIATPTGAPDF